MLIIPLYELCAANPELAALLTDDVGLKVSEFEADSSVTAPYVCWQIINANPHTCLSGQSQTDHLYVQIDVYANSKDQVRNISGLLRTTIEQHCFVVDFTGVERDPFTNLYRIRIDTRWLK